MFEISGNLTFYFLNQFGIRGVVALAVKHFNKLSRRLVHANEQAAYAVDAFIALNHKITFELFYLTNNFLPSAEIKVSYTKIYTLNAYIVNDVVKTIFELDFYIIVYPSHR